jgi:hypothetical protein
MHAFLRPYATAGVALVGASVVAITPIAPTPPDIRVADADVTLAAASIFNIPANLINAVLNMPAASIADMARFSAAMENSGSWHESSAGNVWGWDKENPEMLKGFLGMFMPFPALSHPLGEHLNWWAAANLPMHEGCAFECPEIAGMLNSMFRVAPWEFWDEDGYTFGEVISPYDGVPTSWSGQTVKLDPWEPVKSVLDYLMADPVAPTFPTMYEVITAVANLASSLQTTGHLPDWIAVREIEKFFKHFFPAPEEESVVPEAELLSAPAAETARTFTLDVSTLSPTVVSPSLTTVDDEADTSDAGGAEALSVTDADPLDAPQETVVPADIAAAPVEVVESVVEAVTPDEDADAAAVDATESEADSDDQNVETGGKHRKADIDLSETVKSLRDKFSSADKESTDSVKDADSSDTEKSDTAKSDAGGSSSDSDDSD